MNEADINTVGDFLDWATDLFDSSGIYFGHGTDNPWDEAVNLVLFVLQLPANTSDSVLKQQLGSKEKEQLLELAQRRVKERLPVPYLTNEAWFAGERYFVTQDVIIPRSPIAELIANHFQPWLGAKQPSRILDLCTGSGCLAIYCAKEFPQAQIDAVDISKAAIEVARKNIKLHNCEPRVHAIESDLFAAVAAETYDIIISNPPYVATFEMQDLPAEFLHEPELALYSGIDGLDLTRKILLQSARHLREDGLLVIEVGNSWEALQESFPNVPFTWLEFENGGEGVFLLTAQELRVHNFA